jgi:serine/threonine protein kinase
MPFEPLVKPGGSMGSGITAPDERDRTSVEIASSAFEDLSGQTLGGAYRILELLDEGGMGRLYRAEHVRLKRPIAVKVLASHLAHNEAALKRFNREAEIVSQLHHPHIVHILDFDQTEQGAPYIVMELLQGESLARRLDRERMLPLSDVVQIVSQIAGALQVAHQTGVVHRDLKPDNVFLIAMEDAQIFVKLLDFGISKSTHNASHMTREFDVLGTPDYMAPEQAISTAKADHRADQFALASMTYEMLTGQMPFVADTVPALLHKVVNENPTPPSYYARGLTKDIDAIVLRAMAKHPDARYPHIQDFALALSHATEALLHNDFTPPTRTPQTPPVMASLPPQHRHVSTNQTPSGELFAIAQRYEQSLPIPENPRASASDDATTRALPSVGRIPLSNDGGNEPGTGSRSPFEPSEVGTGQRMPHRPMLRSNAPQERDSAPLLRTSIRPLDPLPPTMRSHLPGSTPPLRGAHSPVPAMSNGRPHSLGSNPPPPRSHSPAQPPSFLPGSRSISELENVIADVRRAVAFGENHRAAAQARRAVHLARDCDEKAARHCLAEATSLLEPLLVAQLGGMNRTVALINSRVSSQGDWTPAHFFLLSRIEQPATLEELLDISPLSRPETLCFITELSAQGIVRVD